MGPEFKAALAKARKKSLPIVDPIALGIRTANTTMACGRGHCQMHGISERRLNSLQTGGGTE